MKKIIIVAVLAIFIGMNFVGILNLGDYVSYSASLVKNKEISIFQAIDYEASEFNDYEDSDTLEGIKNHIDNILHRSSKDPISKIVYKKLLGDIYGDLNYEYLNGKLKISPSSWGMSGNRVPERILEKLDEKSEFWTKEDDLFKMAVLHLSAGHNKEAYQYIDMSYNIEGKEEFKIIKAAILTEMNEIEESNRILEEVETFEEISNQMEIYNSIIKGDKDKINELTDYLKKKNSYNKDDYRDFYRKAMNVNYYRNLYLRIFDSLSDFNREYLISMYNFNDNNSYIIRGKILNDKEPLKNTMVQIGTQDHYTSLHLDEDSFLAYTNDLGEFEVSVPEKTNYRLTVLPNLSDVKGKMCRMPRYVSPDKEINLIEFIKNDFDLKVVEKGDKLELSWNKMDYFDSYSVMIGSMKNGHPYNPEYYGKSTKLNKITLSKEEIIDQSYSSSYSYEEDGRGPNSFFPVLILKGVYFINIKGNIDDTSIAQMDGNINGLYGEDKTYKLYVENDISEGDTLFLEKKYNEAFSEYEKEAENGDMHSIAMLGHIYSYDDKLSGMNGSPYNPEKAIKYLEKSDKYQYEKYGHAHDDYRLYQVYYDQNNLQGFLDYMDQYDDRYGYEYSNALFNLGRYSDGYDKLLNYCKSEKQEWMVKHLIESGLFYIDIDIIINDLKNLNDDKYLIAVEGLSDMDKREIKEYQSLIKKEGVKNIDLISINSSDTGKLYRALLRTNNGPYSTNDIKKIIKSIENEKIRALGEYLTY